MKRNLLIAVIVAVGLVAIASASSRSAQQQQTITETRIERGRQLVLFGGCNDCHTPMKMGAKGLSRT